tara:strand:+ start:377 stop:1411 length:1035 start_codon:yes stop_codon:yes gene_type:complete
MKININRVIITGCAGFIGSFVSKKFLENGINVLGIDNLNNYYDVDLKEKRLDFIIKDLKDAKDLWSFHNGSIEDKKFIFDLCEKFMPDIIINLAAQAGVRYSIENPYSYAESNLTGFLNILELSRKYKIKHLIYASSSSVYGGNKLTPFKETHVVDNQVSFYAATKKSNEVMAHSYSHLYKIPITGLRFFTVYGPWGRPDMAPMIFANSIFKDKPIDVFNFGDMMRDFTYIDDVVNAVFKTSFKIPQENKLLENHQEHFTFSNPPHEIFNVASGRPVNLLNFIEILERNFKKKAKKNFLPMQKGDVKITFANINKLGEWINYKPMVSFDEGIEKFVEWYLKIYL